MLITHTHYDHLCSFALCQFAGSIKPPTSPVTFYLTEDAYEMAEIICNDQMLLRNGFQEVLASGKIKFKQLYYFEKYKIGDFIVIPLPGKHPGTVEKRSANFLIENIEHKIIYYGTDTGYYYTETIDFLKNYRIHTFITECTWGEERELDYNDKHLSLRTIKLLLNTLSEQGTLGDFSKIYITHISHHHTKMHDELQEHVNRWGEYKFPIFIAYDGMVIK